MWLARLATEARELLFGMLTSQAGVTSMTSFWEKSKYTSLHYLPNSWSCQRNSLRFVHCVFKKIWVTEPWGNVLILIKCSTPWYGSRVIQKDVSAQHSLSLDCLPLQLSALSSQEGNLRQLIMSHSGILCHLGGTFYMPFDILISKANCWEQLLTLPCEGKLLTLL